VRRSGSGRTSWRRPRGVPHTLANPERHTRSPADHPHARRHRRRASARAKGSAVPALSRTRCRTQRPTRPGCRLGRNPGAPGRETARRIGEFVEEQRRAEGAPIVEAQHSRRAPRSVVPGESAPLLESWPGAARGPRCARQGRARGSYLVLPQPRLLGEPPSQGGQATLQVGRVGRSLRQRASQAGLRAKARPLRGRAQAVAGVYPSEGDASPHLYERRPAFAGCRSSPGREKFSSAGCVLDP
jgi:hypothetical protein